MPTIKVGIVGATGNTGRSIVDGLLEAGNFDIIALTRPTSVSKPATVTLSARGVTIRECDLNSTQEHLVAALRDIEVLISAIAPPEQMVQIPLATAAKVAGVKRFLPCAFLTVIPAGGLHVFRDLKETVYNHIKMIRLPYTIVDVGWWYQITVPHLPSGKTAYAALMAGEKFGAGDVPSGLTDLRDIGRYVARIITDDRTLNKYVFLYNELWTQNQTLDLFAKLAGEAPVCIPVDRATLQMRIDSVPGGIIEDADKLLQKVSAQYAMSWGIRGDNTPEYAKYLGYVDAKDLYPDFKWIPYEEYVREVLDGTALTVYDDMRAKSAADRPKQG